MRWSRLTPSLRLLRRHLATLPDHKEIIMPKVSPTMTAGRLIVWKKQEGDAFAEGDDIADVESDKATMPISAREDGYIARIFVEPDTPDIPLGQLLAITVEEQDDIAAFKDYQPPASAAAQPAPADAPAPTPAQPPAQAAPPVPEPQQTEYTGPLGPAIMRLLNEFPNLNLNAITPTGPKGRMLKGDVLAAIADGTAFAPATTVSPASPAPSPAAQPTAAQPAAEPDVEDRKAYTDVAVSSMRRAIAKRLLMSKTTVPHRYASAKYELDALLALRKRLNAVEPSPKVSVNDFVIRAVGIALRRVPEMNVSWDEAREAVVRNGHVDVSMAVAIEGGLITPIVTDVDRRGLKEIADVTKDLAKRAKEGTLEPEEFEGGGFSVTNLGMFGVTSFQAIINPPQSGILAVGSGVQRARTSEDGTLKAVTEGVATLSTDARAIEEETAAAFLKEFTSCLTNPENMLA